MINNMTKEERELLITSKVIADAMKLVENRDYDIDTAIRMQIRLIEQYIGKISVIIDEQELVREEFKEDSI